MSRWIRIRKGSLPVGGKERQITCLSCFALSRNGRGGQSTEEGQHDVLDWHHRICPAYDPGTRRRLQGKRRPRRLSVRPAGWTGEASSLSVGWSRYRPWRETRRTTIKTRRSRSRRKWTCTSAVTPRSTPRSSPLCERRRRPEGNAHV